MTKKELKEATKKISLKKQNNFKLFNKPDTIINVFTRKRQLHKIRTF